MYNNKIHTDEKERTYLYILKFQNRKYYVGISQNPQQRFQNHQNGNTTKFVKQNLPIIKTELILLETLDLKKARIIENNKTIELAIKYGIENVSGGVILGELKRREKIYNGIINKRLRNYLY